MVDLKTGTANAVEKAESSRAPQLLGVIASTPLIALGSSAKQAQVVVSGLTPTLVSDINGDVKVGDKITASPIQGIGMKADTSTEVIGTAESNLDDSVIATKEIKDDTGAMSSVKIGIIAVQVNVSYFAMPQNKINNLIPPFLVNIASAIAGKQISPMRVLIGFCSLLVGFIVAGVMLQSGVRASIISLGRNPLAGKILRRSLIDVLLTSLGLLAIASIAFFLILTT